MRLGRTRRQPTQVRCGICLTRVVAFLATFHSLKPILLPVPAFSAALVFLAGERQIAFGVVNDLHALALFLGFLLAGFSGSIPFFLFLFNIYIRFLFGFSLVLVWFLFGFVLVLVWFLFGFVLVLVWFFTSYYMHTV